MQGHKTNNRIKKVTKPSHFFVKNHFVKKPSQEQERPKWSPKENYLLRNKKQATFLQINQTNQKIPKIEKLVRNVQPLKAQKFKELSALDPFLRFFYKIVYISGFLTLSTMYGLYENLINHGGV